MYTSKNYSLAQNNIISFMLSEDRPVTIREIAKGINVSYQTVANHMQELRAKGVMVETAKRHNAMQYVLGEEKDSHISLTWKSEQTTIVKLLESFSSGQAETPVGKLNPFAKEIVHLLKEMLRLSADHLDDEDPKPVTIAMLKEIQARLAQRKKTIKELLETYDSLLSNEELWEPQSLIRALIIREGAPSIPRARSIVQNLNEQMGN
jgi:biotin operon repressor